jgi:hypothetical protein
MLFRLQLCIPPQSTISRSSSFTIFSGICLGLCFRDSTLTTVGKVLDVEEKEEDEQDDEDELIEEELLQ